MAREGNRYSRLIESVFRSKYKKGARQVSFCREDLVEAAKKLGIQLPKNLGDVLYSFRYRSVLPRCISDCAPQGHEWVIRPAGQSRYEFSLTMMPRIVPNAMLAETKIPDATPGIIARYAGSDEQGLLAKLRYNRLVDVFAGVTCYSLQNHLRTTVPGMGQIETDEIYVGVDQRGAQYVFPVQAKGGADQLGVVQIEQDFAMCENRFPHLICRPIATQFMEDSLIAMFSFVITDASVAILDEKHYRLVPAEQMTDHDLAEYRRRSIP